MNYIIINNEYNNISRKHQAPSTKHQAPSTKHLTKMISSLRNNLPANLRNTIQCTVRDEKFANIALTQALKSNMKYHQHGCVAVVNNQIIAKGFNSLRCTSSDGFLNNTCSCHAEIDVMRKIHKMTNKSFEQKRKSSSLVLNNKRSCFLQARKPVRCKKREERYGT